MAAKKSGQAAAVSTGESGRLLEAAQGRGGQHVLAAELLLFIAIVGMRGVAQYGPGDKKDLPADQYGPLFILGNGLAAFFVLAFLAARGGFAARLAAIAGAILDLALLMKSAAHIDVILTQYAAPRQYVPEQLTGSYATGQASVLSPSLAFEQANRQLPPQPKGTSARKSMAYARKVIPHFGLKVSEYGDLVRLWNAESGWNDRAENASGAFGIPQALPADKMAAAGKDWKTNPYTQIRWGLSYIKQTYGSIAAAWAHETHYGWY